MPLFSQSVVFCLALALAQPAKAAIIQVPADEPDVQSGIIAAQPGDTVLVLPGRYIENIDFNGKNIVVASRFLLSNNPSDIVSTIIDGSAPPHSDSGSVVRIVSGENSSATLLGFVITGGSGTVWSRPDFGGDSYREGGGVITNGSSPTIAFNIITDNESINVPAGSNGAGGGGIRCRFGSPNILNNVVIFNRGSFGGGLHLLNTSAIVRNNVVAYNDGGTKFGGGGILVGFSGSNNLIENNTVVRNTTGVNSGGLMSFFGGVAVARNNIIRDNTGGNVGFVSSPTSNIQITFSNVEGGFSGTGNMDQPVSFADSNFLLLAGTSSIDAGDMSPQFDDREDPANAGMALLPSLGTVRNDLGAYGGPGVGTPFPLFTAPIIQPADSLLVLQSPVAQADTLLTLQLLNGGLALGRIDSVQHTSAFATMAVMTELPKTIRVLNSDSIVVRWTPRFSTPFADSILVFYENTNQTSPLSISISYQPGPCCMGSSGNVDNDAGDIVDIADLTFLIDHLFINFPMLVCPEEGNVDGDAGGIVDIADLTFLIDHLFINFPPTAVCR